MGLRLESGSWLLKAFVKPSVLAGFTLTVPTRVVSEANRRDHWAAKAKRAESQRDALAAVLCGYRHIADGVFAVFFQGGTGLVSFTRLGGRRLDSDNLAGAFKALRDAVAGLIGVDDGDPRVTWEYAQQTGGRAGVRVTVEARKEG